MFSLIYGWRQWRGQRLQWFFIAVGLALFSAMLLLLSQLQRQLNQPQPSWVGADGPLVTVQRQDPRGAYQLISNAELDKLAQLPEVAALGRVKFGRLNTNVARQWHDQLPVVFFSDNLPALLQLPPPFPQQTSLTTQPAQSAPTLQPVQSIAAEPAGKPGVYLSHWFWTILDKPALDGLEVILSHADNWRYPVLGVLPVAMNRFGAKRPAIWLPLSESARVSSHQLSANFVLTPTDRAISTRAFEQHFAEYLGFTQLKGAGDLTAVTTMVDQLPTSWSGGHFRYLLPQEPRQTVVVPGVELFPEQRVQLLQNWWLLVCLTVLLAVVVALNLLFALLGQLLKRQQEFALRRMFGAGLARLCRQCLMEQLPLCLAAVVGGLVVFFLLTQQLNQLQLIKYYFGPKGLPFDAGVWLSTTLLMLGFILLCSLLPLWFTTRQTRLSRNRQANRQRWQIHILRLQLWLQLGVVAYTMVLAGSLQLLVQQQADKLNHFRFSEVKTRVEPAYVPDIALQQGQLAQLTAKQVAFSASEFLKPYKMLSLVPPENFDAAFGVSMHYVSANYLQFLQAPLLAGGLTLQAGEVMLNQTAADRLLQPGQQYADLVGATILLEKFTERVLRKHPADGSNSSNLDLVSLDGEVSKPLNVRRKIVGVIADLPHDGIGQLQKATAYQLLEANQFNKYLVLNVLSRPALLDAVLDQLEEWAAPLLLDIEPLPRDLLSDQLRQQNEGYWLLTRLSLLLALLISLLTCISLYYQVQAQLALQQLRLGTLLALGVPRSHLIGRLCAVHLLLLLAGLLLMAGLWQGLNGWLTAKMGIMVFTPVLLQTVLPVVLAILFGLVLLASWLPAQLALRRPIRQLLQAG